MEEILFLGTGGAVPTAERDNTALLLSLGRKKILIDCPGSIVQKLRKNSISPLEVDAIFVTHIHTDHIYGLPAYVHSMMFEEKAVFLYGSSETVSFCGKLLDAFELREKKVKYRMEMVSLQPGDKFELGNSLKVETIKVSHSSSSLAYHFHFSQKGEALLYSGDTPLDSFLFEKAKGISYLIHDCSAPSRFFEQYPELYRLHTHSLALGEMSEKVGVRCLIPCHFFGEIDFPLSEIEAEIRINYSRRLIIPKDFERIVLED